jgi:hypothetical protein
MFRALLVVPLFRQLGKVNDVVTEVLTGDLLVLEENDYHTSSKGNRNVSPDQKAMAAVS